MTCRVCDRAATCCMLCGLCEDCHDHAMLVRSLSGEIRLFAATVARSSIAATDSEGV